MYLYVVLLIIISDSGKEIGQLACFSSSLFRAAKKNADKEGS